MAARAQRGPKDQKTKTKTYQRRNDEEFKHCPQHLAVPPPEEEVAAGATELGPQGAAATEHGEDVELNKRVDNGGLEKQDADEGGDADVEDWEVGRRDDAEEVRQEEGLLGPVEVVADFAEKAGDLRARGDGAVELAVHFGDEGRKAK